MNPGRSLYGRLTINGKRTDLGYATINQLFVRAAQTFQMTPSRSPDIQIVLEASAAKLPDSSIMSREQIIESSLAAAVITDPDEESPFEGITIGRVQEAMASREYAAWEQYCQPDKRMGVDDSIIEAARRDYWMAYPDCAEHFPKWVES